jgi:hypothetical protein
MRVLGQCNLKRDIVARIKCNEIRGSFSWNSILVARGQPLAAFVRA